MPRPNVFQGFVSPTAIRRFHARERDDLSRWKEISDAELARRERKLPIMMPFWKRAQRHQKLCAVLMARMKKLLILNDTGTGKTFLSLMMMEYYIRRKEARCFLVLVPNKTNKKEWGDQIDQHAPHLKWVKLEGSSDDKWQQLRDNPKAEVFIETYGGLMHMICDLKVNKRKKRKTKPEMIINRTRLQKLQDRIDGTIADESTFIASQDALAHRIVKFVAKKPGAILYPMAAKPFGRDISMLWGQANLVDDGYTLGETLGLFRAAFFDAKSKFFGGTDYKLKPGADKLISRYLDDISIQIPANAADLPRLVPIPVNIDLPHDAEAYVEQAKKMLAMAGGDKRAMENAFLRMRQISSGFIGYADDETGEKASFVFPGQPKLDALEDKLSEIPLNYKWIVFHEFHVSAHMIEKRLKKAGMDFVMINGMMNGKAQDQAKDRFIKDDKVKGLVLSNAAGGYGLNLQIAKYAFYYESPVPVILRYQTQKRFERQYSDHDTVFMYDLIVNGTADQGILDFHTDGKNLWGKVLHNEGNGRRLRRAA